MFEISIFLPTKKLDNNELIHENKTIFQSALKKLFGVSSRSRCEIFQTGSDLAERAAYELISEGEFSEIDFLIYCSLGLDYVSPTTSSQIHQKLNLPLNCGTLDIPSGCTGFIYGLSLIKGFFCTGVASNILFLMGEVPSTSIPKDNLELNAIFGDAGVAVLMSRSEGLKIGNFVFGTDGNGMKYLYVERGGVKNPIDQNWLEENVNEDNNLNRGKLIMDGLEVFRFALERVPTLVDEVLLANQLTMNEIDLVIFHQAGKQILDALKKKCKIPEEKYFEYYETVGNTVSCSIPIAIHAAVQQNRLKEGDKILLIAFGIGFTWGGTVIEW
jgi:3-oxoacyl-[acyl-carrier-protein] synthase-3